MMELVIGWLTNATFGLALTTILVFLIAYVYEANYCKYFNIPRSFISTSLNHLWGSLSRLFRLLLLFLVPWSLEAYFYYNKYFWLVIFCLVLLFIIRPIKFFREYYLKNVNKALKDLTIPFFVIIFFPPFVNTIIKNKLSPIPDQIFITLCWIIFTLYTAYTWGRIDAKAQLDFLIIKETSETLVVLKKYGDSLICAPLEQDNNGDNTKNIKNAFKILSFPKNEERLILKRIGPLEPMKINSNLKSA